VKKKKTKAPIKLKYSYMDIGLTPVSTFDFQKFTEVILFFISGLVQVLRQQICEEFQGGSLGKEHFVCAPF
jgi:hypothetical protein